MARISRNSIMADVQGMIGNQIVYKKRKGKPYTCAPPEVNKNRKPGEKEQANRNRFKNSTHYAKHAVKDAAIKSNYAAVAKEWQTAYNVAFQDASYGPEVSGIITKSYAGEIGDVIFIQAKDNFKVIKVYVSIYDGNNDLVEKGEAVDNGDGLNWIYTVTQLNKNVPASKIIVTAYDLPYNEAMMEVIV